MESVGNLDRTAAKSQERGPRPDPGHRGNSADDRILGDLIRKLGKVPFLEREEEAGHALDLVECRKAFAGLVQQLPLEERAVILAGALDAPRRWRRWPLHQVDACYHRLRLRASRAQSSRAARILPEAKRLKRRIDRARDKLVRSYLRFVVKVAREAGSRRIPLVDLVQEGTLGLMEAVDRFEPERGFRLMTYAYWWIKRAVTMADDGKYHMIRIPRTTREKLIRLMEASSGLRESLGRQPTVQEIAEETATPVRKVHRLQTMSSDPIPLEDFGSGESTWDLLDRLSNPDGPDPLNEALDREKRQLLLAALHGLGPHEQRVLRLRFGLDDRPALTLEEVGHIMKLSRERIRQIEIRALKKLRLQEDVQDLGSHFCPSRPPKGGGPRGRHRRRAAD
jgi:RNA polymerase sigma factor (sigma-70 family)